LPAKIIREVNQLNDYIKEKIMRKLNFITIMIIVAGAILLTASSAKCSSSDFTFDGSGYLSVFFVGSKSDIHLDWSDPYTNYGERQDVLNVDGNYYVGMQTANYLTVDRIWIINDGEVGFTQTYQDGYIGASLTSDGLGILCGSGFSTALLADASFEIGQYAGRFNPHLTSTEVNIDSGLGTEGLGCSQMSAQLYGDWYSPSYHIFDYWNDSWVDDSEKTGLADVYLTDDEDGMEVEISSSWTTPWINIDIYTEL